MHNLFKQIYDWDLRYSQQNPDTVIEILINEKKKNYTALNDQKEST